MECLLDTNKGPSILDDDCELKNFEKYLNFEARRIKDKDSDGFFQLSLKFNNYILK